jgi:ABC-type multidrug transport system fused ATPase/permease subunit
MKINKAIGEKVGLVLFSVGMTISGLVIGFINGWSLALVMLAIGPIMGVAATFFGKTAMNKFVVQMRAYAQSGGYAEQCLSSVKVVVAFGKEKLEIANYSNYLAVCAEIGKKQSLVVAFSVGIFFAAIYGAYTYGFGFGALWI